MVNFSNLKKSMEIMNKFFIQNLFEQSVKSETKNFKSFGEELKELGLLQVENEFEDEKIYDHEENIFLLTNCFRLEFF